MKLSVIIPIYNEKATIKTLLDRIGHVRLPVEREIIIVDDGSTDSTRDLLRALQSPGVIICFHEKNQGKGAAVRTGLHVASGDIILIQDGDLEYDPADYPRLIQPIMDRKTRVVYGSRILGRSKASYFRYYWGGRFLSLLSNLLYGIHITDEPTCYKVFDAILLKGLDLRCKGFEFCPEVTAKVSRLGESITEVPISYTPRSIQEGKKIRWTDGLMAMWTLFRYRRWKPS
ncbi:MAG: glycosyltransferase family 2 protein [Deltaproteobacteria bacterium]|nr:glycosyltransferase family 2 protein [Deltaproteobacteria bacterium]MBW2075420.1 glycosyltransferase family 2 protein [Deltaproteobacteria bacterium]RLB81975.1 MAG: glycosyltransferase family 2 protein [Deltaproteobacteria bacterium]